MEKEPIIDQLKEFKLSSIAVDNGTSIFLLAFMIMLFGVQSYMAVPKEQYPEAYIPQVFINTPYFGNSAAEIENLIAKPLEKELVTINGIDHVLSNSLQDYSVIIAQFSTEMSVEEAVLKVKDAVDKAKSELPKDLDQDPSVEEIVFSDFPIMTVNVSGDFSADQLRDYAEYIQDELEDITEVSKVDLKGALDREVKIDVDLLKMAALQVSFDDVETSIMRENLSMSGGEIVNNDFRRSIRVIGEFKNAQEIEDVIVKSEMERPIYLRDFAKVTYGFKERTSYARSEKFPVISLDVTKRKGQNLLNAADNVNATVAKLKDVMPENLNITIFNDSSINTRNEVKNLENSIISGVILVTLVLLFFLGLRNAAFVGISIPLSMLMGILFLHVMEVSLNIVTLFSLILALGLLVDNAIVVVENIYRYMQEGYSGRDAAKYATGEVAQPIIVSTLTTLAAFLPLAFWPGVMGMFMRYMPITLMIVLTSSLFVALVINPVFTSRFMKIDQKADERSLYLRRRRNVLLGILVMILVALGAHIGGVMWVRNLMGIAASVALVNFFLLRPASFVFQNKILPKLENAYFRFIRFALNRYTPLILLISTFVLLFASLGLLIVKSPKIEYFPVAQPAYINAFIELPIGKDIEATNKIMDEIETKVDETIKPYRHIVDAVLSQIGENTADPNRPPEPGITPHKARLTVSFVPTEHREGIKTSQILEKIRNALVGYPGVQIVVAPNADGPPTGPPINIELKGDHIDSLALLSERMIAFINKQGFQGIEELKADVKIGKPELIIDIDREAARRYGISTGQIASVIRTSVFGKEVSKFKDGDDEYPIQLRANLDSRNNVADLMSQPITFRDQARRGEIVQIPISTVASYRYSTTYNSLKRKDQDKVITIYSNLLEGYNANEIVEQMKLVLREFDLPPGYSFEFTGEQESQAEDMAFLNKAFLIALFCIFIIIVAQFNSLISPFIIVLTVLFSTIGVFLGYIITGKIISVIFTGVGIISLAGIVVNNAIVLIDYINLLIDRKLKEKAKKSMSQLEVEEVKQAIILGGATRLRPVLLTAITTVLGLVPLAIGFNFDFFTLVSELNPHIFLGGDNTAMWGPMAWTIIYGLLFATFLTLVIVPVMYWLAFRVKRYLASLFYSSKNA